MTHKKKPHTLFYGRIKRWGLIESLLKLNPKNQFRNPVMFVVEVGSLLTTLLFVHALFVPGPESAGFILGISAWLWATVLFANFAESVAEGRGKAQADALRGSRKDISAKKLSKADPKAEITTVPSSGLKQGDIVLAEAGDIIPGDGEVEAGVASVNESAITGESVPVIRESGGDRSAVTGGTEVLSDWLVVRITANPGETFLDRMINMVEGAKRQKTPNEVALNILLARMTIIFLLATVTLLPFSIYSVGVVVSGPASVSGVHPAPVTVTVLVA